MIETRMNLLGMLSRSNLLLFSRGTQAKVLITMTRPRENSKCLNFQSDAVRLLAYVTKVALFSPTRNLSKSVDPAKTVNELVRMRYLELWQSLIGHH